MFIRPYTTPNTVEFLPSVSVSYLFGNIIIHLSWLTFAIEFSTEDN